MIAGCVPVPAGVPTASAVPGADVLKRWLIHYDEIADEIADKIKIAGSGITADDLDGIISELSAVAAAIRAGAA